MSYSIRWLAALFILFFQTTLFSAEDIFYENWVSIVFKNNPNITLRDMVIPGTHDSGTYNLSLQSDVSPDAPSAYALAKGVVADWGRAQSFDFHTMLRLGVRHFDLRILKHKGHFVCVHGLVGMRLDDLLSQVRNFADTHPLEPIILEVAKTPDDRDVGPMIDIFNRYVSHRSADNTIPLAKLTLADLWKKDQFGNNKNIVVVFTSDGEHGQRRGYFNGEHQFTGTWADTEDTSTLKNRLLSGSYHKGRYDHGLSNAPHDKLFYSAFTLTPQASTIAKDVVNFTSSGSLLKWTKNDLRPLLGEWVTEWSAKGIKPNIMTADFFEYTALVPMAIALNLKPANTPSQNLIIKEISNYNQLWHSTEKSLHSAAVYRAMAEKGYSILGDVVVKGIDKPAFKTFIVADDQPGVARPLGYNWVWNDTDMGGNIDASIWRPIAPPGFVCLGDLVTQDHSIAPPKEMMQCIHHSYLSHLAKASWQWDETDSGAKFNVSWWVGSDMNDLLNPHLFRGSRHHARADQGLFWGLVPTKVDVR